MRRISFFFVLSFLWCGLSNFKESLAISVETVCYHNDRSEGIATGANDIIVVKQADGSLRATPLHVRVGKFDSFKTFFYSREGKIAHVSVNGVAINLTEPEVSATDEATAQQPSRLYVSESGAVLFERAGSLKSTCRFTSGELRQMRLRSGSNEAKLIVPQLDVEIPFNIHLMSQQARLVVTDIDGTITTSDVQGFVLPQVGVDAHHEDVIEFFSRVGHNGYQVVYLSARAMALAKNTREYLFETLQNKSGFSLPRGPLIVSPRPTVPALLGEPNVDKTITIKLLTGMFDVKQNVIEGCYGNHNTDTQAYMDAGVMPKIIYLVNNQGKLVNAATGLKTTYQEQISEIDSLYPST